MRCMETAWEYFQNSAFDAADYIFQRNPHLVQNQFGVTLGGPIHKDKAFYFLGLQVLRNAGEVVAIANTPTPGGARSAGSRSAAPVHHVVPCGPDLRLLRRRVGVQRQTADRGAACRRDCRHQEPCRAFEYGRGQRALGAELAV